jgi:2-keto-myo-inositol isomerase
MKLSYNEATALKCSTLEKDLVLCEKTGYDFIEIRLDMLRGYLKTHTTDNLKSFFANSHIKPHAFNALLDINFLDDSGWKIIMNDFRLACEVGKQIGDQYIVVCPTRNNTPKHYSEREVFDDTVKTLIRLSDFGRKYGMKIAFEPVGNLSVNSVHQAWEIIKAIGRADVGITFDAFNLFLNNKLNHFDDMKIVDLNKVFVVHIDDSEDLPLEELDHCHRMFPGEGIIDLANYIATLKEMHYEGMVSVETFRPEYWAKDPEWVIRTGYETTRKIIESAGA